MYVVAGLQVDADAPAALGEAFAEEAIHGSLARASSEGIAQSLRSELEKAVDDEDYEKAAAIRDKLKELES